MSLLRSGIVVCSYSNAIGAEYLLRDRAIPNSGRLYIDMVTYTLRELRICSSIHITSHLRKAYSDIRQKEVISRISHPMFSFLFSSSSKITPRTCDMKPKKVNLGECWG